MLSLFIVIQTVVFKKKKKKKTKKKLPTYLPTHSNKYESRYSNHTIFEGWPQERNTSIFLMHFIYF